MVTCYLRYWIDPDKVAAFAHYAGLWTDLVARFGGKHLGYFLPHESDSDLAIAIFSFSSLAAYEQYRIASRSDPDCIAAYAFAKESQCIRRYERRFLSPLQSAPC